MFNIWKLFHLSFEVTKGSKRKKEREVMFPKSAVC